MLVLETETYETTQPLGSMKVSLVGTDRDLQPTGEHTCPPTHPPTPPSKGAPAQTRERNMVLQSLDGKQHWPARKHP